MDAFEKKRKQRAGSSSSVESLTSSPSPIIGKPEARRSFGTSRPTLDEKDRNHGEEKLSQKFKGRLRALTGGHREEGKAVAYQGT